LYTFVFFKVFIVSSLISTKFLTLLACLPTYISLLIAAILACLQRVSLRRVILIHFVTVQLEQLYIILSIAVIQPLAGRLETWPLLNVLFLCQKSVTSVS